jgi:hypothetical protein
VQLVYACGPLHNVRVLAVSWLVGNAGASVIHLMPRLQRVLGLVSTLCSHVISMPLLQQCTGFQLWPDSVQALKACSTYQLI